MENDHKIPVGQGQTMANRGSINLRSDSNFASQGGNSQQASPVQRPISEPMKPAETKGGMINEEVAKSKKKTGKVLDNILLGIVLLSVLLVPLFFITNLPSVLEFAKQSLLVLLAGIAFPVWAGKMIVDRRSGIRKSFILIPVFTLVLIYVANAIFSIVRYSSVWGSLGEEGNSLITFFSILILFFVSLSTLNSLKRIRIFLFAFLISTFLAVIYGLLQIYGVFIFKAASGNNFFNTIGSIYLWGSAAAIALIISSGLFLSNAKLVWKIILIVFSILLFFSLVIVNFKIIWAGLIVAMVLILGFAFARDMRERGEVLVLPMAILALSLLMLLINRPLVQKNLPIEIGLSTKASWDITKETLRDHFLLGSGVNTFTLAYLENKPDGINQTQLWNVRFSEARGTLAKWATELGFLGFAAYVFFIGTALFVVLKKTFKQIKSKSELSFMLIGIAGGWVFLTFIILFYLTNLTMSFLWWMLLALFLALSFYSDRKENEGADQALQTISYKASLATSFLFVITLVGVISVMYFQTQRYIASAHYQKALVETATNGISEDSLQEVSKAVAADPSYDLYHLNLSIAASDLANKKSVEKPQDEMTDDDFALIQNLIRLAVSEGQQAITINPNSSNNYFQLATIYQQLVGLVPDAQKMALEQLQKAGDLDPKNPIIPYQEGQLYLSQANIEQQRAGENQQGIAPAAEENISKAKIAFEKAVEIKSDYSPAHFMIAVIYEQRGEIDQAIEKEKELLAMNPNDSGVMFQLGLLYYKNENFDEAQVMFENAVKVNANYSNARYFLGLIYDRKDEKDKAISQFEKIAELNPDNEEVKQIISNLEAGKEALAGISQQAQNTPPIEQTQQVDQNLIQSNAGEINPETNPNPDPED